jgi:hypothetical protein
VSLWSKTLSVFTGVDLDAEQQRSDQIAAQSVLTNQELVDRGFYTPQEAADANRNFAEANARNGTADVVGSVTDAFEEGAKEGAQNVLKFPGQAVGYISDAASISLKEILSKLPWWAYVGGLAALFVWLGGLTLLRGILARR